MRGQFSGHMGSLTPIAHGFRSSRIGLKDGYGIRHVSIHVSDSGEG